MTEENGRQKQLRQRMLQRRYSSTSDCNISNNKFSNNRYNSRISSSLLTSQVRGYAFWSSNDNNNNNNNESPSSSSSTTNELENGSSSMSSSDGGGESVSSIVTDLSSNTPPGAELVGEVAQIAASRGTHRPLDVRHGILSPREWIRVVPSDCCINYSHENVTTTIYRNANAEYGENAIGSTGNGATSRTCKRKCKCKMTQRQHRDI